MRHLSLFVLISLLAFSCIDQKDYTIKSAEASPAVSIPLIFGDLTMQELLYKDSAFIKVDPDNLIYLDYTTTVSSADLRNQFLLQDELVHQSIAMPGGLIPPHNYDIRVDSIMIPVDLNVQPSALTKIDFKAGMVTYTSTIEQGPADLDYQIIFSLPDFISKNSGLPLSIRNNGSARCADYTGTLSQSTFIAKFVLIYKATPNAVTIGPHVATDMKVNFTGMDFYSIEGFLGDRTISPPSQTLEIAAFGDGLHSANLSLDQSVVSISVINQYGAPAEIEFLNFSATKSGASLPAQVINPAPINYPTLLNAPAATTIDVMNSKNLIDFGPTGFVYNFNIRFNKGQTTGDNFLGDLNKLNVSLNVKIPMYGQASNVILRDTVAVDLSTIDQSSITKASLKMLVNNQLPLDANLQFYLADANHVILDSLFTTGGTLLVKGSAVDSSGQLLTNGNVDQLVPLSTAGINKIFQSKYIIIKGVMNTSLNSNGNPIDVRFKANYKMSINLGLLADTKIHVTF